MIYTIEHGPKILIAHVSRYLCRCSWRERVVQRAGLLQVRCRELWTQLLVDEERVGLLLHLLVDVGYGLAELLDRFVEVLLCHHHRLRLQLLHDCLVDQGEQVLDQRTILRLCLLSQHQDGVLRDLGAHMRHVIGADIIDDVRSLADLLVIRFLSDLERRRGLLSNFQSGCSRLFQLLIHDDFLALGLYLVLKGIVVDVVGLEGLLPVHLLEFVVYHGGRLGEEESFRVLQLIVDVKRGCSLLHALFSLRIDEHFCCWYVWILLLHL